MGFVFNFITTGAPDRRRRCPKESSANIAAPGGHSWRWLDLQRRCRLVEHRLTAHRIRLVGGPRTTPRWPHRPVAGDPKCDRAMDPPRAITSSNASVPRRSCWRSGVVVGLPLPDRRDATVRLRPRAPAPTVLDLRKSTARRRASGQRVVDPIKARARTQYPHVRDHNTFAVEDSQKRADGLIHLGEPPVQAGDQCTT